MLEPSDVAAIEHLQRRWLACELEGRASDVLELCSANVVWFRPGGPPMRGKEDIRAWLQTSRDRIEDISISNAEVDGDGSAAYKIANFCTRYVPSGSSDGVTVTGWHFWIMRRNARNVWQVTVVAWNLMEPYQSAVSNQR